MGGTLLALDDGTVAVADPDRDQISVVDIREHKVEFIVELEPGALPGRMVADDHGRLFVVLRGSTTDGHRYVAEACRLGAAALLVEEESDAPAGVPSVLVPDARRALAPLAARFFGEPEDDRSVILYE